MKTLELNSNLKDDLTYCNEIAEVISNKEIAANTYSAVLKSPKIANLAGVGQFVNVLPDSNWEKAMRRPMSLAGAEEDNIELIYKVFGEGTQLMSHWKTGDQIDIIGPLGNGWDIRPLIQNSASQRKFPLLIGGGVGIAPIMYLSQNLMHQDFDSQSCPCIMGARMADEHFLKHDPENGVILATDDGSLGIKGNVIDALKYAFTIQDLGLEFSSVQIFCCGPPMMMESVKQYAESNKIDCQVALETIMACGFGICQGCTVQYNEDNKQEHSYRDKFGLVCLDGPVFNVKEIKTCKL